MKILIPSSPRASVAVECGGMPPLWHWETCIPVPCPDLPAHPQPSRHPTRIPKSGFQSRLLYSIKPQSRQKTQQSRLIKPHQGKPKFVSLCLLASLLPGMELAEASVRPDLCRLVLASSLALGASPPGQSGQKPQQSCLIKANQGIL